MQLTSLDRESLLEAGFIVLAVGFLAGLGLLVGGRLAGGAQRHRRHAEAAPSPGNIPAERHQQLSTSPR
jgi:hypothetical protein